MDKNIPDGLKKMKETFLRIWEELKKFANEVLDIIYQRNEHKKHEYNWHVPLDTTRHSQIKIPSVDIPRIRNHI